MHKIIRAGYFYPAFFITNILQNIESHFLFICEKVICHNYFKKFIFVLLLIPRMISNNLKSISESYTARTFMAVSMLLLVLASIFIPLGIVVKTTFYDDYSNGNYKNPKKHIQLSLRYNELHKIKYVNNHEIMFGNKLYDIVEKSFVDGIWHFVLYEDSIEQKDLTLLHQSQKHKEQNNKMLTNFLFLINAPVQNFESEIVLPVCINKLNEHPFSFYNCDFFSNPFRPPC